MDKLGFVGSHAAPSATHAVDARFGTNPGLHTQVVPASEQLLFAGHTAAQLPPHPSEAHVPAQLAAHWHCPPTHVPPAQVPQTPPQPLSPHALPAHCGVQPHRATPFTVEQPVGPQSSTARGSANVPESPPGSAHVARSIHRSPDAWQYAVAEQHMPSWQKRALGVQ